MRKSDNDSHDIWDWFSLAHCSNRLRQMIIQEKTYTNHSMTTSATTFSINLNPDKILILAESMLQWKERETNQVFAVFTNMSESCPSQKWHFSWGAHGKWALCNLIRGFQVYLWPIRESFSVLRIHVFTI